MKKIDLLHLVEKNIKDYRLGANDSLRRNYHMNDHVMKDKEDIPQEVIDALLVDFLNYMGTWQGVDYGMYTYRLEEDRDSTKLIPLNFNQPMHFPKNKKV